MGHDRIRSAAPSPREKLFSIQEKWNVEIDIEDVLASLKRPSVVVGRSGVGRFNGWKDALSEKQISRVLNTVNSFGISFYSDHDEADYDELYSAELSRHIQLAGIG